MKKKESELSATGVLIRQLAKEKKMTLRQVSVYSELPYETLMHMSRPGSTNPGLNASIKLSDTFDCDITEYCRRYNEIVKEKEEKKSL